MSKLRQTLKSARLRVALPFLSYEVKLDELLSSASADERIAKLGSIKEDLEAAVVAVEGLKQEAEARKMEADDLKDTVQKLEDEKNTVETLLKLPEESFTRVLTRASAKGRVRGLFEGILVGFATGVMSSLLIWYITK